MSKSIKSIQEKFIERLKSEGKKLPEFESKKTELLQTAKRYRRNQLVEKFVVVSDPTIQPTGSISLSSEVEMWEKLEDPKEELPLSRTEDDILRNKAIKAINYSKDKDIVLSEEKVFDEKEFTVMSTEMRESAKKILEETFNDIKRKCSNTKPLTLRNYLKDEKFIMKYEQSGFEYWYDIRYPSQKYPYMIEKSFEKLVSNYTSNFVSTNDNIMGMRIDYDKKILEYEFSPISIKTSSNPESLTHLKLFLCPALKNHKVSKMKFQEIELDSEKRIENIIRKRTHAITEEELIELKIGKIKHENKFNKKCLSNIRSFEYLFQDQDCLIDLPFNSKRSDLCKFFINRAVILMLVQQVLNTMKHKYELRKKYRKIVKIEKEMEKYSVSERRKIENFLAFEEKIDIWNSFLMHKQSIKGKFQIGMKRVGTLKLFVARQTTCMDLSRIIYMIKDTKTNKCHSYILKESQLEPMIENSVLASSYVDLMNQSSACFVSKLLYFIDPTATTASIMSLQWMCQNNMNKVEERINEVYSEKVKDQHSEILQFKIEASKVTIRQNSVDSLFSEILFKPPKMQNEANYLRCIKKLIYHFPDEYYKTYEDRKSKIASIIESCTIDSKQVNVEKMDIKSQFTHFTSSSSASDIVIEEKLYNRIYKGKHVSNYSSGSMLELVNHAGSSDMKAIMKWALEQTPLIYIFVKDQTQGIREISVMNSAAKLVTQYAEMMIRPFSRASNYDYILKEEEKEAKVCEMYQNVKMKKEKIQKKIETELVCITIDFSAWNQNIDIDLMAFTLTSYLRKLKVDEDYIEFYNILLKWYESKKIEIPFASIKNSFNTFLIVNKLGKYGESKHAKYFKSRDPMKKKKSESMTRLNDLIENELREIFLEYYNYYLKLYEKKNEIEKLHVTKTHNAIIDELSKTVFLYTLREGMGQGILGTSSSLFGTIAMFATLNNMIEVIHNFNFDFIQTSDDCAIVAEINKGFSDRYILDNLEKSLAVFNLKLSRVKCSISRNNYVFFNSNRYVLEELDNRKKEERNTIQSMITNTFLKKDYDELKEKRVILNKYYLELKSLLPKSKEKKDLRKRINKVEKDFEKIKESIKAKVLEKSEEIEKFKVHEPVLMSSYDRGKTYHVCRYLKALLMDNYSFDLNDEFSMHTSIMETMGLHIITTSASGDIINTMHETNLYILRYNWLFTNYERFSPEFSGFRPSVDFNMPFKQLPAVNQLSRYDLRGITTSESKIIKFAVPINVELRLKEKFKESLSLASRNLENMLEYSPSYLNEIHKVISIGGKEERSMSTILSLTKKPFYNKGFEKIFPGNHVILDHITVSLHELWQIIKENDRLLSDVKTLSNLSICKVDLTSKSLEKPPYMADYLYQYVGNECNTKMIVKEHAKDFVIRMLGQRQSKSCYQYIVMNSENRYTHYLPREGITLTDYLHGNCIATDWILPQEKIDGKYCKEGVLVKLHHLRDGTVGKIIYYLLDDCITYIYMSRFSEEMDMYLRNDVLNLQQLSYMKLSPLLVKPLWTDRIKFKLDSWIVPGRQKSRFLTMNVYRLNEVEHFIKRAKDPLDLLYDRTILM